MPGFLTTSRGVGHTALCILPSASGLMANLDGRMLWQSLCYPIGSCLEPGATGTGLCPEPATKHQSTPGLTEMAMFIMLLPCQWHTAGRSWSPAMTRAQHSGRKGALALQLARTCSAQVVPIWLPAEAAGTTARGSRRFRLLLRCPCAAPSTSLPPQRWPLRPSTPSPPQEWQWRRGVLRAPASVMWQSLSQVCCRRRGQCPHLHIPGHSEWLAVRALCCICATFARKAHLIGAVGVAAAVL